MRDGTHRNRMTVLLFTFVAGKFLKNLREIFLPKALEAISSATAIASFPSSFVAMRHMLLAETRIHVGLNFLF